MDFCVQLRVLWDRIKEKEVVIEGEKQLGEKIFHTSVYLKNCSNGKVVSKKDVDVSDSSDLSIQAKDRAVIENSTLDTVACRQAEINNSTITGVVVFNVSSTIKNSTVNTVVMHNIFKKNSLGNSTQTLHLHDTVVVGSIYFASKGNVILSGTSQIRGSIFQNRELFVSKL